MRTIWHSLAWKEWHEHKWKLAAIMVVLTAIAFVVCVKANRVESSVLFGVIALCTIPFAIFLGLGSAASENSLGTMRFLHALPVPMWLAAIHKLVFGLITV